MTTTATRTGSTRTITYPDGTTFVTTGKRAEAAVVVSIGQWSDDGRYSNGIHATAAAGHKHARHYGTPRHPGGLYWQHTTVIPVTEAQA